MFQFFGDFYNFIVVQPELNLLYFLFQLTNDIGVSIVLLAVIVNLIILPLFAKNYINLQKNRILRPKITEIQKKYKDEPQKMLQEMRKFNKKHGLNNGYFLIVIIVQLLFISGLYVVINRVVEGQDISGLYESIWGETIANFKGDDGVTQAFGFIDVSSSAWDYIWITALTVLFSFMYGFYTAKLAPQPELPKIKEDKKPEDEKDVPVVDPEMMKNITNFQMMYFFPIFLGAIQFGLPVGVNIYFLTSSIFSLLRQVFLTQYYAGHSRQLVDDIMKSDPTYHDDDPSNNLNADYDPAQLAADEALAMKVLESQPNMLDPEVKKKVIGSPSKGKSKGSKKGVKSKSKTSKKGKSQKGKK